MSHIPFDEKELQTTIVPPIPAGLYGMPGSPTRKYHSPITPKENFLRMARGEMPLWLPNMGADFNMIQPLVMPDAAARIKGGTDWFGIRWKYEPLTNAGMVEPGTRRHSDITAWETELDWPDPNAIDWQADYAENYAPYIDPEKATAFVIVNGLFERTADLTSFSDTFCYLLEEQDALHAFYDKLTDFHIALMKIARDIYHADCITFHDDMGSQRSAFMSPDTFAEVLLPHYRRMNEAAHAMGLYVNLHSCGNVGVQIPNFIESGFDFWEGQDACNDKLALMEQYGNRLGQVSMFFLPPDMPDDAYEAAITQMVNGVGKTGRYITWFGDMNPDRAARGQDLIYSLSRKLYAE